MLFKRRLPFSIIQIKRNLSALYMTGDKAKESFAVLTPHLEFTAKLDNRANLEENLKRRRITFDVNALYDKWNLFRELEHKKDYLEARRIEIAENLRQVSDGDEVAIAKWKNQGKIMREDLKLLKDNSYCLEENFVNDFLRLPNEIHPRTPIESSTELFSYYNDKKEHIRPEEKFPARDHLSHEKLVEYYDETCYYLMKEAATFDLRTPLECVNFFRDKNFQQISNSDFVRTVIGEAAGFNPDDLLLVAEEDNSSPNKVNFLHLTGGASLNSFLGFVAKLSIFPSFLPLRLVARGKQYRKEPQSIDRETHGLYSCCQSSTASLFIATENQDASDSEYNETLLHMIDFYKMFNRHFRVILPSADQLSPAESLRASFEMYSPFYKKYIEVGNLSSYNDFISKRLLFNYRDGKSYKFPHIISGTVVNVTKILAILLESSQSENCLELPK